METFSYTFPSVQCAAAFAAAWNGNHPSVIHVQAVGNKVAPVGSWYADNPQTRFYVRASLLDDADVFTAGFLAGQAAEVESKSRNAEFMKAVTDLPAVDAILAAPYSLG